MSFVTQDAAIEKLLRSHYGQWVPCYELADLALQYCRAVNSIRRRLRQTGDSERVENKVERVNGKAHGSYRIARTADLVAEPAKPPAVPLPGSRDWFERENGKRPGAPPPDLGPLFGQDGAA
jgi:hypothetical protein